MDFTYMHKDTPVPESKGHGSSLVISDSEYDSDVSNESDNNREDVSESSEEEEVPRHGSNPRKILFETSDDEDDDDDDTNDPAKSRISKEGRKHNNHHTVQVESNKSVENVNDSGHGGSTVGTDTAVNLNGSSSEEEEEEEDEEEKGEKSYETVTDASDDNEASVSHDKAKSHENLSSVPSTSGSLPPTSNSAENDALIMSLVKKAVGVGNVDPMIAQQQQILSCNIEHVRNRLAKSKMLLDRANIDMLPDKGKKLRDSIDVHENELVELTKQMKSFPEVTTPKLKSPRVMDTTNVAAIGAARKVTPKLKREPDPDWKPSNPVPLFEDLPPRAQKEAKPLGPKALEAQEREQTLTEERLKDLHGSLNARPSEDERAKDPKGLKISLMPHQQHALAWLLWREKQRPHGGILADDMGLGKTLTMISLIITTIANKDPVDDSEDDDDEWVHRKRSLRHKGGTLVVCPASVLSQWEAEINKRVRGGMLAVELFHGNNREAVPRRLAKNDVVITTYNLVSREYNKGDNRSVLYEINWKRVILDEAHIIRNRNSQVSESVCHLRAGRRWALTGTPIQNKEMDLYALLKFLKCTPFDDIRVWKRWVDNKNDHGHERLATVMKTLMLRRTKQELQAKGGLGALPDKNFEEIHIKLDSEEQLVYEKVLVFSRTLFAQFLHQRAEKNHMHELHAGKFDAPTFLQTPRDTQFTKVQNQLLARHAGVIKAHEILVLLLRLRQICCHPALIHEMLDREDLQGNEVVDEQGVNPDVTSGLEALKLEDDENIDPNEIGVDRRVVENLLTTENPVFNPERQSSKMRAILKTIQEILDKGDKMVVVSQWTSMLEVVRSHLSSLKGATYDILSGNVPVKNRQRIMDSFNKVGSAPQILLLSLTAGGVGLNLVGGNHLLLLDVHWNPQLEAQAQDRIYRVGQKKSVYIYKFICLETVEQRIKALQDHKLAIAQNVLTGAGTAGASKLSLDDLKSLFSL